MTCILSSSLCNTESVSISEILPKFSTVTNAARTERKLRVRNCSEGLERAPRLRLQAEFPSL